MMRKFAGTILLVCACVALAFAKAQTQPMKASSTAQSVKQLEHDWLDAEKAGDVDKLSQILADDWVGIGPDGKTETKQGMLADVKSGKLKMESSEIGPMEVKVLGSVAVVQGSDTEKSAMNGKDSSGKYAWMDVFAKRDGKWMAVRSQTAMVK
jgi:ketosteroid isomerase-like protein